MSEAKFIPLRVVATSGIVEMLDGRTGLLAPLIARHTSGDWGDMDEEDCKRNDESLKNGTSMLMSVFEIDGVHTPVWLITEHDRSVCTIMLPSEY